MSISERARVALFIDWDNLAISTAADLGGAAPDIRAIVQRAQQYGTIIIAKAYAEWSATSDRLAVYRAGIEPVYAPTFRFEPDTATQQGKGKSLADPCMVADCVDALHLLPDITIYVIVTGDKDMIPVVRLAQLRGRRVIVIGPDYVAGVLREMADEFIPYRSLIEVTPPRPLPEPPARRYGAAQVTSTEEPLHRRGGERRHAAAPLPRHERGIPTPLAGPPVPLPARPKPVVEPAEVAAEAAAERPPVDDVRAVYNTIIEILKQRRDQGRDRVRATNLKDALMQRMPGFSERRFGFAKFKDLLTAAEKAGFVRVMVAGPVHWILLPGVGETEEAKPPEVTTETAPAPVAEQPAPAEGAPAPVEERRGELIRFIHQLGERSRWLTYTYVLTNLISHFGRTMRQSLAEAQARATLNDLVQLGVLRVDKEPQEVEVGGARHRVRMCHLNVEHELVAEAIGFQPEESKVEAEQAEGVEGGEAEVVAGETDETPVAGNGAVVASGATIEDEHAVIAQPTEEEAAGEAEGKPAAEGTAPAVPEGAQQDSGAPGHQGAPAGLEVQEMPAPEPTAEPVAAAPPGLEQAFAALERVVFEATNAAKPAISASSLRGRLASALGAFNERDLGFSRFKDFLAAAQRADIVRVESRGPVTWVSMPRRAITDEEAGAEPSGEE